MKPEKQISPGEEMLVMLASAIRISEIDTRDRIAWAKADPEFAARMWKRHYDRTADLRAQYTKVVELLVIAHISKPITMLVDKNSTIIGG
jgi:hypothetical protein